MKRPYWIIVVAIAIAALLGAVLATVGRQSSQAPPIATTPIATTPSVSPASPLPSDVPATNPSPVASSTPSPKPSPSPERLTSQSKVTINGIGSVRVGMTVEEASRAAGVSLVRAEGYADPSCYYVEPQGNPKNIAFMVTNNQISRIDVWNQGTATTRSGAGIGSTEVQIQQLYPGQVEVTPHEYVEGGHYLSFVPQNSGDRNFRVVFETDAAGRVTQFRSGKLPEVMWVEGCL